MDIKFNTTEEYVDWIMSRKELWLISRKYGGVFRILDITRSNEWARYVHATYRVNGIMTNDYFIVADPTRPRIFNNEGDALEAAIVSKLCGHL